MLTQDQRTEILRRLPIGSPVKFAGNMGVKVRNGKTGTKHAECMTLLIDGYIWRVPYTQLTCPALEVYDRIYNSTQTPSK